MAKFAKGQRVQCVVADNDGFVDYFPGDIVTVGTQNDRSEVFFTIGGLDTSGLWINHFEPVIEESSAPMQNAEPVWPSLNVGDTVRVLEDGVNYTGVRKGDIGTVKSISDPAWDYISTEVLMENGRSWFFNANKHLEIVARVVPPVDGAAYPDGNPKTSFGRAKPSTRFIPPVAIFELGMVMEAGAAKYGQMNWRASEVSLSVYTDAADRHLMALRDGQNNDPETNCKHAAHVMACMAIVLDAGSLGKLIDDRPLPGATAAWLAENTKVAA